jgi:hypothetical protein
MTYREDSTQTHGAPHFCLKMVSVPPDKQKKDSIIADAVYKNISSFNARVQ